MATILSFHLSSTPVSAKTADHYAYFTPPSSIAGKLCYVHTTYFQWDWGSLPSSFGSRDTFQVSCDWTEPWAITTDDNGSKIGAPLAYMSNTTSYPSGPMLVRMPDNPHVVRFTVSRSDGDNINGSAGKCYMTLCLKVIVADGRQPPLGE